MKKLLGIIVFILLSTFSKAEFEPYTYHIEAINEGVSGYDDFYFSTRTRETPGIFVHDPAAFDIGGPAMADVGWGLVWDGTALNVDQAALAAALSFNNAPARTIQTVAASGNGWRPTGGDTRNYHVSYSVTISCAVQIGVVTNVEGYVVLETATTNSSTAGNWTEIARVTDGNNIALAIALSTTQKVGGNLSAIIPAGSYVRIRSVNVSGTPTYVSNSGQEVLF